MHDVMTLDLSRIAQDLQIRKVQVESVVQLLDEGNTVPFITRYRKERTGGLKEDLIRQVQLRIGSLRQLAERKQTILKSIEGQGKLTDDLRAAILAAETPKRLEDLYLPYKPKKRTLATVARERGLEPLAQAIWNRDPAVASLEEVLVGMVNPEKELPTTADVLLGVQHILAEQIAETADVRAAARSVLWETGKLTTTKSEQLAPDQGLEYKDYFQFGEPVRHIPPHRILAINRGEKEGPLKARLEWDAERVRLAAVDKLPLAEHPHASFLKTCAEDALTRLLLPSLEREIRRELTEEAEDHAVRVFARNLRCLLLQPPLRGRRVLAIDPGFRTGCKTAALDEVGNLLEETVIFPHPPQNKKTDAKLKLEELARKHQLSVIAIGNGTACRETEELVSDLIARIEARRRGEPLPEEGKALPAVRSEASASPATAQPGPDTPVATIVEAAAPPSPGPSVLPLTEPLAVTNAEATPSIQEWTPPSPTAEATPAPGAEPSVVSPDALPIPDLAAHAHESGAAPTVPDSASRAKGPTATASAAESAAASAALLAGLPEAPADLAYVIVNEAGASVYSASAVGREEFPNYDATLRGTISIGRRLQDPLSELVKIDPQNIGVGLYQHDLHPRRLKESLEAVIESCVNHVGVDLNTASVPLLRHVSGLNQLAARELVDYRKQHGPFRSREQLQQVPGIGPARYVQAAGFLKIESGDNPLDQTWIHPESYPVAQRLLAEVGFDPEALRDRLKSDEVREKLKGLSPEEVSARLEVGVPTLRDILDALARPGRDPREDLPPPIFKKGILKLEDLQPGMELKGTVLNVVDFGAFVDVGLKDSGLVHISQMANRYVKNPYEVVAVGDVVTVWVLTVDKERRRVSLTMIKPGTERKPPEKKPPQPRPQRAGGRPPRGRRPAPAQGQGAPPPGQSPAPAAPQETAPVAAVATAPREQQRPPPSSSPPHQAARPRKPHRQPPKPKLSKAALEGDAPLRTFSELKAFFEAKQKDEPTPAP